MTIHNRKVLNWSNRMVYPWWVVKVTHLSLCATWKTRVHRKVLLDFELRILLNGKKLLCLMHCTLNTEHHTKSIISTAWSQNENNSKTRNSLKPMKINLFKANKYIGSYECTRALFRVHLRENKKSKLAL